MKHSIFALLQKFFVLALLCGSASACSKDDDDDNSPAGTGIAELPSNVIGTFTGQLAYTKSGSNPISNSSSGTATLSKTGDRTYSIAFSDGVPTITGLKFQTAAAGSYATVSSDGSTAGMALSSSSLSIGVTKGSETWGFTGNK